MEKFQTVAAFLVVLLAVPAAKADSPYKSWRDVVEKE